MFVVVRCGLGLGLGLGFTARVSGELGCPLRHWLAHA